MKKISLFLFSFLLLIVLSTCDYNPYTQGENLYVLYCENCHMEDGTGLRGLIPPLADADYLKNHQSELPCLIKNGIKGPIQVNGKTYDTEMVGISTLNDIQINNIINYINHSWGNQYGDSNVQEVKQKLNSCGGFR